MTHHKTSGEASVEGLAPVDAEERILTLDVLRGLALLGVIIANMQWFSGLVFRLRVPAFRVGLVQALSLDSAAFHAIGILVNGKAIATLSFLFGLGFAMQMLRAERRGVSVVSLYCRRLAVLLAFGLVHTVFLWYGDILSLYAVLGFALLWAARRSDRTLLVLAGILLVGLPLAIGTMTMVTSTVGVSPDAPVGGLSRAELGAATLAVFQSGTYPQIVRENVVLTLQFYEGVQGLTNLQYLGLFLLGLYAGRRRVFERVAAHDATLWRIAVWGLVVGLSSSIVQEGVVTAVGRRAAFERSDLALLMNVLTIGTFVQAAGYIATVTLLLEHPSWKRWLSAFVPAGRMALTNYLTQTVVCLAIFYGFGAGLIGRTGPALGLAIALAIYATQMIWSRLWLSRFRMGPLEWVWRSGTYGRRQPLLSTEPAIAAHVV